MNRKGYHSISCIPQEILDRLNLGLIESATLAEWLSVNQLLLLRNVLTENGRGDYLGYIEKHIGKTHSTIVLNRRIGELLFEISNLKADMTLFDILSNHVSDHVRCWAISFAICQGNLNMNEILSRVRRFADDDHFNVREFAWLGARNYVIDNLDKALNILIYWVNDKSENIRRFASEVTRPVGVWCRHIPQLKENPSIGLQIIEPLKSDISRYVQNSVANWLNDASKTCPSFVLDITDRWSKESDTKETEYIIKRATRTIRKSTLKISAMY